MSVPRRIYIDCTATYFSGLNTGIQRVVNNIISRADNLSKKFGVEIVPVVVINNTFKKLQDVIELRNQQFLLGIGTQGLLILKLRISKFIWRSSTSTSTIVAFFAKMAYTTLRFIYLIPRRLFKITNSARLLPDLQTDNYNFLSADDVLLMLDSFWMNSALDLAEKHMVTRPVIVTVIYDLIPITHPQYCDKEFVKVFELLFPRIVALSDGLIGISQTVQHSIADYVSRNSPEWMQKGMIDYFYLGADFKVDTLRQTEQLSAEASELLLSEVPFFLAVGTVEPRKGYGYLMDGFEILWRQGAVYPLVIVGKVGWLYTDILKKAEDLKKLGRPLFMLHDLDDYTLDLLYRKSAGVIFPSFVEGFGLPMVEALVRGKQVLASDIEVFKEIGGNAVSYFEPGCAKTLAQRVSEFFDQSTAEQESADTKDVHNAIYWDESANSLIEKSIKMYSIKRQRELSANEVIEEPKRWAEEI